MHLKVTISLAFAFKVTFCTNLTSKAILSDNFLSICLQSNDFVHIWCQKHFKMTISLAFAFKVTVLHICGAKCILKVMIFLAFAFKVTKVSPMPERNTCKLQYKIAIVDH